MNPCPHGSTLCEKCESEREDTQKILRLGLLTLRNLLSVIHRDGGQHTDATGITQSSKDAQKSVLELFTIKRLSEAFIKKLDQHRETFGDSEKAYPEEVELRSALRRPW